MNKHPDTLEWTKTTTCMIHSEEANQYLQQALQIACTRKTNNIKREATTDSIYIAMNKKKRLEKQLNSNDESDASSSSSLEYSSGEEDLPAVSTADQNDKEPIHALSQMSLIPIKTKQKPSGPSHEMMRQLGSPPFLHLPLQTPPLHDQPVQTTTDYIPIIQIPIAILSSIDSEHLHQHPSVSQCQEYLNVSNDITKHNKPIVVLLLRSGRFAGAIFQKDKCLVHRACQRYTVRRGQGGAQNSNDNAKGKAKSMGAQLRRAGEQKLKQDVLETLKEWKSYLEQSCLIFISCPKNMKRNIFEDVTCAAARDQGKIRRIPLSVGRPSYEAACAVHSILMTLTVKYIQIQVFLDLNSSELNNMYDYSHTMEHQKLLDQISDKKSNVRLEPTLEPEPESKPIFRPLTPLHEAAKSCDIETLTKYLEQQWDIHAVAGELEMTPLHYAASSNSPNASNCISILLLQYHADPCQLDAHSRPPYYLATNEKNRNAFRKARFTLGEDYCSWDKLAKVGPPLSEEDLMKKKEKAADKKRRQRQRQKEKKMMEKQKQLEMDRLEKEEKEKQQMEEDAKRARAGLKPKPANVKGVICDFCQAVMKRSQAFHRLDFMYCSTDCVKKHQRELTAAAALARFGGSNN